MVEGDAFTEHLAAICRDLAEQPLSGEVANQARPCLLDHPAALLYGTGSHTEDVGRGTFSAFGRGEATLIARTQTTGVHDAAIFHGLIATAEDLADYPARSSLGR